MIMHKSEEILEGLFIHIIEQKKRSVALAYLNLKEDSIEVKELIKKEMVTLQAGQLKLTKQGEPEARDVVRRHRPA